MQKNRLTRAQWAERLAHLAKDVPFAPDELSAAQLLLDVIVNEQTRISTESLAVLAGLSAAFFRVGMPAMTPRHTDAQGCPVFTEEQVAERLGVPVEEVRRRADALVKELGDEAGIRRVAPESLKSLN